MGGANGNSALQALQFEKGLFPRIGSLEHSLSAERKMNLF